MTSCCTPGCGYGFGYALGLAHRPTLRHRARLGVGDDAGPADLVDVLRLGADEAVAAAVRLVVAGAAAALRRRQRVDGRERLGERGGLVVRGQARADLA